MAAECDVQSEIEVLESIYLDELQADRREDGSWEVSLVLYPSTGEDSVSQFVRLTLTLTLDQQYPSSSPAISIHNPRGLSDDKLSSVQKCLQVEAQSCLGSPVLYQLIEKAKEILTESNIPHGNCVICLYGFKEGETFTKTSCYHYFHSHCLGRYASHSERELRQREKELEEDKTRERADCQELTVVCPVCREPLAYDVDLLLTSPAPQLPELDEAAIGSEFQRKWIELQKLLERQRSKGGIIDPEEESNRFLIHINEPPSVAENGNLDADPCPGPQVSSASNVSPDGGGGVRTEPSVPPGLSHCRGGQGPRRHQHQARGGPRRGGRSRPHHGRAAAAPVAEQLDKLSLSSNWPDWTEGPVRAQRTTLDPQMHHVANAEKLRNNQTTLDPQMHVVDAAEKCEVKPPRRDVVHHHAESALETECQNDNAAAADSAGGRGHRGRRRGPHRPAAHGGGGPGSSRYHWDGRPSRSRGGGGGNSMYSRGGGGGNSMYSRGGGGNRGHGRGYQQKAAAAERERGREEVL